MNTIREFLERRSSTAYPFDLRSSHRGYHSMNMQVETMMSENTQFVRENPLVEELLPLVSEVGKDEEEQKSPNCNEMNWQHSRVAPEEVLTKPLTEKWFADTTEMLQATVTTSTSAPQLRQAFALSEPQLGDEVVSQILDKIAAAVIEVCRTSRGYEDTMAGYPNRVILSSQGVVVVAKYQGMEERQKRISNMIEKYLDDSDSSKRKSNPLLSDRVPNHTVAIQWEGPEGIQYKRVRYLLTYKVFDYFFDCESAEVLKIRWDKTRFFDLPFRFEQEPTALRSYNGNPLTCHYWQKDARKMLENLTHSAKSDKLQIDYIGKDYLLAGIKPFAIDCDPLTKDAVKKTPLRRTKSESLEHPVDITFLKCDKLEEEMDAMSIE